MVFILFHDFYHHDSFYTYFSKYRLNIKAEGECYLCHIEELMGRLVEKLVVGLVFVLLFIIFVQVFSLDLLKLFQKSRFLTLVSLGVRMNN